MLNVRAPHINWATDYKLSSSVCSAFSSLSFYFAKNVVIFITKKTSSILHVKSCTKSSDFLHSADSLFLDVFIRVYPDALLLQSITSILFYFATCPTQLLCMEYITASVICSTTHMQRRRLSKNCVCNAISARRAAKQFIIPIFLFHSTTSRAASESWETMNAKFQRVHLISCGYCRNSRVTYNELAAANERETIGRSATYSNRLIRRHSPK